MNEYVRNFQLFGFQAVWVHVYLSVLHGRHTGFRTGRRPPVVPGGLTHSSPRTVSSDLSSLTSNGRPQDPGDRRSPPTGPEERSVRIGAIHQGRTSRKDRGTVLRGPPVLNREDRGRESCTGSGTTLSDLHESCLRSPLLVELVDSYPFLDWQCFTRCRSVVVPRVVSVKLDTVSGVLLPRLKIL